MSCTACADACAGGDDPKSMAACIRTDLDCADLCAATISVLCRQTEPDYAILRAQVQSMKTACKSCGDTCMSHAGKMAHCKQCGETCRACESKCDALLSALRAA